MFVDATVSAWLLGPEPGFASPGSSDCAGAVHLRSHRGWMDAHGQTGGTPHQLLSARRKMSRTVHPPNYGDVMVQQKKGPQQSSEERAQRYIVPSEVEQRLGISPATRRRWTNHGLLRAYPIGPFYRPGSGPNREGNRNGSRVRYLEEEVNALAASIKSGALGRSPKPPSR